MSPKKEQSGDIAENVPREPSEDNEDNDKCHPRPSNRRPECANQEHTNDRESDSEPPSV